MNRLDPRRVLSQLSRDIPESARGQILIVGSLAAAHHFRSQLASNAVNTKDADLIIHPTDEPGRAAGLARSLLRKGWRRTDRCVPSRRSGPSKRLSVIRLYPPGSTGYFIELLGLPRRMQRSAVVWDPVRVDGVPEADAGWYVIPRFRFMGLTGHRPHRTKEGFKCASPAMMALALLLSHSRLGTQRIGETIGGRRPLRSAKDLGRVLAMAYLAGPIAIPAWLSPWVSALKTLHRARWRVLARRAGTGLRRLLAGEGALEDARVTTDVGLLNGLHLDTGQLKANGLRIMADLIEPLEARARA